MSEDVQIKFATDADIDSIMQTLEGYFHESIYKDMEPYDVALSIGFIAACIEQGHIIIAVKGSEVVGLCMITVTQSFWKRPEAGMSVFYVKPDYRGTKLGRLLVESFVKTCKRQNYMFGIGGSTSGFGHQVEKQFENMLVKNGFHPLGRTCIWYNDPKEK